MDKLKEDILSVVRLAGKYISSEQIQIIDRGLPHHPKSLPAGKFGIYSFVYQNEYLKIGKVGTKSKARFVSQHYNPNSSNSNLAKSLLLDESLNLEISDTDISQWIKSNVQRIDYIIDETLGIFVLNLIESFLHLKFNPKYEGFGTQR